MTLDGIPGEEGRIGDAVERPAGLAGSMGHHGLRGLYPGYFALVMATGIVSNALFTDGFPRLADALLAVNAVAFPALVAATLLRAVRYPRDLWHDLADPRLVFTFFTFVAAADVLGVQIVLRGEHSVATGLWLTSIGVWLLLGYFSFALLTFFNSEEGADIVHGGWLIAIVGTESLVLLGARLAPAFGGHERLAFWVIYALWGVGIVFYGIFVTLFSYRYFFLRVEPGQILPLAWVVMGAAAIAANAGSALLVHPPDLPFLSAMRPFVNGTTLVLWAWATWWIPLLVIYGIWRHVVHREPLRYDPMFWSIVFPLGMYAVTTYRLSLAAHYRSLQTVSEVMVWVAFAAWLAVLADLLVGAARSHRETTTSRVMAGG